MFYESTCHLLRSLKELRYLNQKSRGGSVRTVTTLLVGHRVTGIRFQAEPINISPSRNVYSGCVIHKASSAVGTGAFPPEQKRLRR